MTALKKSLAVAVFGAGMLAISPALALECVLVEQRDTFERRYCHYECVTKKNKKVSVERKWMKCTSCRQRFSK